MVESIHPAATASDQNSAAIAGQGNDCRVRMIRIDGASQASGVEGQDSRREIVSVDDPASIVFENADHLIIPLGGGDV